MKSIKDIRMIDKEEGQLIFNALHKYYFGNKEKDGILYSGNKEEITKLNQLYQDFKNWLNQEE